MFSVGEVEVLRVEESLGHGFQPNVLLPDWNAKDIEPHLPWLAPTYYDPAVDKHRLLDPQLGAEDAPPHHPDRHLRRQPQGAPDAAALPHAEPALHGELRQGRPEGRGHRLRAVHAPARRSRRLEHQARQRPLGADLPQRQVRVLQDRPRLLRPRARGGRQGGAPRPRVQRQRAADPGGQAGHGGRRHPQARRRHHHLAGAGAFAGPRADHAARRRAPRRCSSATSCTTPSRSITRTGAAPSAPTPSRRARRGGACSSMRRPRAASSIRCHFAGPHFGRIGERPGGFAYLPGR